MKFLKYFLILLFVSSIFHHPSLESFARSKRFFSSFKRPAFKSNFFKNIFANTSKKFKKFRTKFSFARFKNLSKKYTQKPIAKKVTKLTTIAAATMTFKSFVEKAFAQEKEKIEHSLSYKFASVNSIEELQEILPWYAGHRIDDFNFAWQEIIKALIHEEKVQKQGSFVGYHSMPNEIYFALVLYTFLYNEKNNIQNKENFIYLRTFESVEDARKMSSLELWSKIIHENRDSAYIDQGSERARTHLFSMSPFLFPQSQSGITNVLSVRAKKGEAEKITSKIIKNISQMYTEDQNAAKEILELVQNILPKKPQVLLQLTFHPEEDNELTFFKQRSYLISPENIYLGYNKENLVKNVYLSLGGGKPYDWPEAAELFQKLLHNQPIGDLKKAKWDGFGFWQFRAVITPEFLQERNYEINIVDIGKDFIDFQNTQKDLVEKAKKILQKHQQPSSIKIPEN